MPNGSPRRSRTSSRSPSTSIPAPGRFASSDRMRRQPRAQRDRPVVDRPVQRSGGHAHAVFDSRIDANHNEELLIARELQHAVVKRQLSAVIHTLAHCAGEMIVACD